LGKQFVKELGLESSTDTYSRWLSHYIADKMAMAEQLPAGIKKEKVEKECFQLILKVWEHRWTLPTGKRPLQEFEPILETLKKLASEKIENVFFGFYEIEERVIDQESINSTEVKNLLKLAEDAYKVARVWIKFILHEAAQKAGSEQSKEILKNAVRLKDSDDVKVIHLVFENEYEIDEPTKNESQEIKQRIEKLNGRLKELEKFTAINQFVSEKYHNEIAELEKQLENLEK
jgi:hypothetical protein